MVTEIGLDSRIDYPLVMATNGTGGDMDTDVAMASSLPSTPPPSSPPPVTWSHASNTKGASAGSSGGVDIAAASGGPSPTVSPTFEMCIQMQQQITLLLQYLDSSKTTDTLANLDERAFRCCKTFDNKEESWMEWNAHFLSSVRDCDSTFAGYLWTGEKSAEPIDIIPLGPTNTQLAAVLYSRLSGLTTYGRILHYHTRT